MRSPARTPHDPRPSHGFNLQPMRKVPSMAVWQSRRAGAIVVAATLPSDLEKTMNLIDLLVGGIPASFASSHDLENSLACLRSVTKASSWFYWDVGEAVVGEVSEIRVFLRRTRSSSSLFAPCFTGQFEHGDGGAVVLAGRFASHWSAYLHMAFWLGFLAFFVGGFAHVSLATGRIDFVTLLIIIGIGANIVIILNFPGSWCTAKDDIRCLRETMSDALSGTNAA